MFEIKENVTRNGVVKYAIILDNGEQFNAYENGVSASVRQGADYICSVKLDEVYDTFEKVNFLANNGGDYHSFLRNINKRRGEQSIKSDDGCFSFGYSIKQEGSFYVYAHKYVDGRQRSVNNVGSEDEAKRCIEETCREYNETGRFRVFRTHRGGVPFPEEYCNVPVVNVPVDVPAGGISQNLEDYFINEINELKDTVMKQDEMLTLKDIEIENLKDNSTKKIAAEINKRLVCPICGDKRIVMTSRKGEFFLGCCSGEMHRTDDYDELAILLQEMGFLESWENYHGLTRDGKISVGS